jgi:hypothetical protein
MNDERRPKAAPEPTTTAASSRVTDTADVPRQIRRRRDASYRLPPMADGRRDPDLEPDTRHRCFECGRDVRLARFHRIDKTRIVCRRCHRDRWAPR